jgi:hypothetical protein
MSEARTEARIGDAWLLEVERTQTCCGIHQEASGQALTLAPMPKSQAMVCEDASINA